MRSEGKKRTLELSLIQGLSKIEKLFGGATSNRKSVCMALFLNKLYLYHDVSPLNKVFTALHRSTSVCFLGTISEHKDNIYIVFGNSYALNILYFNAYKQYYDIVFMLIYN